MPDLPGRLAREKQTAAAVLLILRRHWEAAKSIFPRPHDWFVAQTELQQAMAKPLAETFSESAGQFKSKYGGRLADVEVRRWANQWADGYASALARDVAATTQAELEAAAGKGSGDLARRAQNIGITETTRAVSAGENWINEIRAMQGEQPLRPIWNTERDGLVCEVCGPLHGVGREVYDQVSVGGPPAHPRCRCWLEYQEA